MLKIARIDLTEIRARGDGAAHYIPCPLSTSEFKIQN
jgi:hypothetical protein